ncbi:aldo/keto reductase [Asticcacaulis sp. 201]|uniref:aldo/keto reductase n=1 Tax=Asticcacaulis sp. 201 TaxID=3028787 RepID=UPI002917122A|nr:aldo/keto reductase [Asticcacaulis sp. 201]MDV6330982.1 aldo/keto reductase [Asticcacaulis sp. 201]
MTHIPANRIGVTQATISEIGFGGGGIGNLYRAVSDDDAEATVQCALDLGIRYFDTAPRYGHGLSERRLGAFLPDDVVISTKVGRRLTPIARPPMGTLRHGFMDADPFEEHFDYSYDGVMRAFDASLERLKRDRVDIIYAHDIGALTHGEAAPRHFREFIDGGLKAMHALKAAGRVNAIGLGVNEEAVCHEVLDHADIDVVLLAGRYTLLEQAPANSLLPRCVSRNVSIVLGGPYNSGILIKGVGNGPANYDYGPAPAEIVARVARIEDICRAHGVPMAAAALQFPLAHPSVVSVIPGMGRPDTVTSNLAYYRTQIPSSLWTDLRLAGLIEPSAPTPTVASGDMCLDT